MHSGSGQAEGSPKAGCTHPPIAHHGGRYSFNYPEWVEVSGEAKDFVSSLLVTNRHKRLTAVEALKHPWLRRQSRNAHNLKFQRGEVAGNLKHYARMNPVSKARASCMFLPFTCNHSP